MKLKQASYPDQRTMNLYYKPDRTTRPATIALYVLFAAVLLLGLSKVLVYDLWVQVRDARQALAAVEQQLEEETAGLSDYAEVQEEYRRYAPTDLEKQTVGRIEILSLLDETVGSVAQMDAVSISGSTVQVQFSQVTLAQTAEIVTRLEASPLVESIAVDTASTTGEAQELVSSNIRIQLKKEVEEG